MPTHSTTSPVEAATKTVDALLSALDGNSSPGAAAAYRSATQTPARAQRMKIWAACHQGPNSSGMARHFAPF